MRNEKSELMNLLCFSFLISPLASPILLSLTRRILLCQHELFAHQTARTASVLRLTSAAQADEDSLSPFFRTTTADSRDRRSS